MPSLLCQRDVETIKRNYLYWVRILGKININTNKDKQLYNGKQQTQKSCLQLHVMIQTQRLPVGSVVHYVMRVCAVTCVYQCIKLPRFSYSSLDSLHRGQRICSARHCQPSFSWTRTLFSFLQRETHQPSSDGRRTWEEEWEKQTAGKAAPSLPACAHVHSQPDKYVFFAVLAPFVNSFLSYFALIHCSRQTLIGTWSGMEEEKEEGRKRGIEGEREEKRGNGGKTNKETIRWTTISLQEQGKRKESAISCSSWARYMLVNKMSLPGTILPCWGSSQRALHLPDLSLHKFNKCTQSLLKQKGSRRNIIPWSESKKEG